MTAWVGLATSLVALVAGVLVLYRELRKTNAKVDEVHIIVNQQRTDMVDFIDEQRRYQRVLEDTLRAAGVAVPVDAPRGHMRGQEETP